MQRSCNSEFHAQRDHQTKNMKTGFKDGWSSAFCDWLRRTCPHDDTCLPAQIGVAIAGCENNKC